MQEDPPQFEAEVQIGKRYRAAMSASLRAGRDLRQMRGELRI